MTRATGGVEPFPFKTAPRKGLIVQAGPSLPQTRNASFLPSASSQGYPEAEV